MTHSILRNEMQICDLSGGLYLNSRQGYSCIGLILVLPRKQCLKLVSLLLYCQYWQNECVGICGDSQLL